MRDDVAGPDGSALSEGLGPNAQVQACRPEDRDMLATPAGAELVAKAAAALDAYRCIAPLCKPLNCTGCNCAVPADVYAVLMRAERADDFEDKPRGWVPVAERLPTAGCKVLVCYRNSYGRLRRTCAHYSPLHTVDASCWDEGEPDETEAGTFEPEGWWEEPVEMERVTFIADEVTHWMPLPEPPPLPALGPNGVRRLVEKRG